MKKLLLLLSVYSLLTSCTSDNLEEMHLVICDSTGIVSFASDIQPIMNAQCGTNNSSCHINPSADGGCGLANYTDMLDYLVTPAKDIKFMKTVNHDPSISATLYMPKLPLPKIDDCSIQKLQAWINDGKLNN